jgi:ElaB/YqjD/DUF883 family membrane-anchored ribosome-binding protein
MKINKNRLKEAIQVILTEVENSTDPTSKNATKLSTGMMTGGQFTTGGKEQRADVDGEVDNNERDLIHKIDQFLLNLAALPGVELQKHRTTLQTILGVIQKRIAPKQDAAPNNEEPVSEGCGAPVMQEPTVAVGVDSDGDSEGRMAKGQLYRAAKYATELEEMIMDDEELDGWVQAKITKASDYLSSVKHYLEYKKMRGDQ